MSPRAKRLLFRSALVLAALVVVALYGILPWWLGGMIAHRRFDYPDRENAGLTPASFDLAFEKVELRTADGVPLRGWWVPAAGTARGTAVLVHGLNRSRIEMVRKVSFLHAEGWNALLFDLRHHGESGNDRRTFGFLERQDVRAAVLEAHRRAPGPVVSWGVSMGAAAVMLEAADDMQVAGVVADSSFRSLRDTIEHHLRIIKSLRLLRPAGRIVVYWIGRRGGYDPDTLDVGAAAVRLRGRPVLFVANAGDRRMPPEIAFEMQKAAGPGARVLVVPGHSHGGAWREGTAAYETAVRQLLADVAGSGGARAEDAR